MDTKRHYVLQAAAKGFLEYGYQHTSMQAIAESCNISKATIYKYFSSKEEMGLQTVIFLTEQLLYELQKIMRKADYSPKGQLRKGIILRLKYFDERSRFIDVLMLSFSPDQKEKYIPIVNKAKFEIFQVFSRIIAEAFELDNEAASWEIALNMNGLIREIAFVTGKDKAQIDEETLADFIIDSLEAIAKQRLGKKPLLTGKQIEQLNAFFHQDEDALKPIFQRNQLLQCVRKQLENYGNLDQKKDLLEALGILEQEYHRHSQRPVIINAMLAYLADDEELAETVLLIKNLQGKF